MASLISDSDKAAYNSVIDDIHDTFARPIVVYKEAEKVVIATSNTFNPYYANNGAAAKTITNVPQSQTFQARIYYWRDFQDEKFNKYDLDNQAKIQLDKGTVRLKVNEACYVYIKDAKRIEFDGSRFLIDSSFRKHGLFGVQYYTLYLKPTT